MKSIIQDLSKSQIRYIFECIKNDLFETSDHEIIVKRSNVNYSTAKDLLFFLSEYSQSLKKEILRMIHQSESVQENKQVIAMDPVTGGVIITGMFLLTILSYKTNQAQKEAQLYATLLKFLRNPPSPELEILIRQLVEQTEAKPDKLELLVNNLEIKKLIVENDSKYTFFSKDAKIKFNLKSQEEE